MCNFQFFVFIYPICPASITGLFHVYFLFICSLCLFFHVFVLTLSENLLCRYKRRAAFGGLNRWKRATACWCLKAGPASPVYLAVWRTFFLLDLHLFGNLFSVSDFIRLTEEGYASRQLGLIY